MLGKVNVTEKNVALANIHVDTVRSAQLTHLLSAQSTHMYYQVSLTHTHV